MTRSLTVRAFALVAAAGFSGSAMADDLTPPPWRFNPGTTVQHWDFTGGPGGGVPDALPLNNTYGTPIMTTSTGSTWLPAAAGRTEVWDITGGSLSFLIPNTGNQNNQKELWLQVTFFGPAPITPFYSVATSTGAFNLVSSSITALPQGWTHELTKWTFPNCPPFERITIGPGLAGAIMLVDQVVVDTQCIVPAPGAATLLGFGGLLAARRRRR